ncbi:hypothetical protein C8R44DRAFT_798573 [Mycena epipterygia]|nr:hypothetical protein C8R44DRAFT_798573 [Mycena epipterygia]
MNPKNSDFLAGATGVTECLIHELGRLLTDLTAQVEDARGQSVAIDESVISEPEVGMSALWVAQTALAVTRERFHQERTARKALEQELNGAKTALRGAEERAEVMSTELEQTRIELRELTIKVNAMASSAKNDSIQFEEKYTVLEVTLGERDKEINWAREQEREARQELGRINLQLIPLRVELNEREKAHVAFEATLGEREKELRWAREQESQATQELARAHLEIIAIRATLEEREEEFGHTHAELISAYARVEEREDARNRLRLARQDAANSYSIASNLRIRSRIASRSQRVTRKRLRAKNDTLQTAHEELQLTCRQLIDLVEGLQAERSNIDDVVHKLRKKYEKNKDEKRALKAKLARLEEEKENGLNMGGARPAKRKAEADLDQTGQKQKKRVSM